MTHEPPEIQALREIFESTPSGEQYDGVLAALLIARLEQAARSGMQVPVSPMIQLKSKCEVNPRYQMKWDQFIELFGFRPGDMFEMTAMMKEPAHRCADSRSPAEWFRGQPAQHASDTEIAGWFRRQPVQGGQSGVWFRGQPAPNVSDAEIAGWFRRQQGSATGEHKREQYDRIASEMVPEAPDRFRQVACSIMHIGDRMDRNGELSVTEMDAFLCNTQHRDFARWMLGNSQKNFKRFDNDKNGAIDVDELQFAVQVFTKEQELRGIATSYTEPEHSEGLPERQGDQRQDTSEHLAAEENGEGTDHSRGQVAAAQAAAMEKAAHAAIEAAAQAAAMEEAAQAAKAAAQAAANRALQKEVDTVSNKLRDEADKRRKMEYELQTLQNKMLQLEEEYEYVTDDDDKPAPSVPAVRKNSAGKNSGPAEWERSFKQPLEQRTERNRLMALSGAPTGPVFAAALQCESLLCCYVLL